MYRVLESTPKVPPTVVMPLRGLVERALTKDPALRPTALEVGSSLSRRGGSATTDARPTSRSVPEGPSIQAPLRPEPRRVPSAVDPRQIHRGSPSGPRPSEPSSKRRRFRMWGLVIGICVSGVLVTIFLVNAWSASQWYVGQSGASVAIFRGVAWNSATSELVERTEILVAHLPPLEQGLVSNGISVQGRDGADAVIGGLRDRACSTPPLPRYCDAGVSGK